jgi:uncharacterized protein
MSSVTRRVFLKEVAMTVGGAAVLADAVEADAATPATLPRRVLGRTKERMPIVSFGLAPLGSDDTSFEAAEKIVMGAMDRGVTYLDVAPVYGNAEAKLKAVLKTRRDDAFLVTKVNNSAPDADGVQKQLEESLKRMGTDRVDAVHIHNLGDFDMEKLLKSDGPLAGLQAAKKRGLCRFIGVSGHMRPHRFATLLNTGEIDLMMVALNFADRYNYDFEGLALPAAKKHGTAVVAMKVLGGAKDWKYDGRTAATLAEYHEKAIRYSLSLPDVSTAVIGFSNLREVDAALKVARALKPLSASERSELLSEGKRLAEARGLYYGPVVG